MHASNILRVLGSQSTVARELGATRSAVSNWSKDGIPPKYWPAIVRLAARTDGAAGITLELLEAHTRGSDRAPAASEAA